MKKRASQNRGALFFFGSDCIVLKRVTVLFWYGYENMVDLTCQAIT
jgi:hypothetical protein